MIPPTPRKRVPVAHTPYLERMLARIVDGDTIGAVEIWLRHSGQWLGCLKDGLGHIIPGSTGVSPQPRLQTLIETLASMAEAYRQEVTSLSTTQKPLDVSKILDYTSV
jgi:hypothetical protein